MLQHMTAATQQRHAVDGDHGIQAESETPMQRPGLSQVSFPPRLRRSTSLFSASAFFLLLSSWPTTKANV